MQNEQPEQSLRDAEAKTAPATGELSSENSTGHVAEQAQPSPAPVVPARISPEPPQTSGTGPNAPVGNGNVSGNPFQRPAAKETTSSPVGTERAYYGTPHQSSPTQPARPAPRPDWNQDPGLQENNPTASAGQSTPDRDEPAGLLDMTDGEVLVQDVDSGAEGRFILTNYRIIYQGHSAEAALFASAAVKDVKSIEFGRKERDTRSAWWGVLGILAAIAVWQVTTNQTVGAAAGLIVGGISALLLADYWFRPHGLILRFGTAGGRVEGPVSGRRMREAEQLAARVQVLARSKSADTSGGTKPAGDNPGI